MSEFLDLLLAGPKLWIGVIVGLVGAWLAWAYLPTGLDRASIAGAIFVACLIGGGVWSYVSGKRREQV